MPPDIRGRVTLEVPFHFQVLIDKLANPNHLIVGEIIRLRIEQNPRLQEDFTRGGLTYPMDVGQRYLHSFILG